MTMTEPAPTSGEPTLNETGHEAARREKMRKLIALGVDPWGQRFDERSLIGDIRARSGEVVFVKETGEKIAPPTREANPDLDFRKWLSEQGKGDLAGPKVRAAGRIVLHRDKGKLRFIIGPGEFRFWSVNSRWGRRTGRLPNAAIWAT